jgi:phospholipase/lecithinase/hemolysin
MKLKFIFILALICLSKQALSFPYTQIYVFGDSLSDTGRLFQATTLPPTPYFEGRVSNGKLWIEELSETLNLTYNPDTNFAWVGATSGTTNVNGSDLPGLQQQLDNYLNNYPTADENALYIVWAGANDFSEGVPDITKSITNIVALVSKLRQHGAKHILVPNLPPLDQTPRAITGGTSAVLAPVISAFNKNLAQQLAALDVIQVDIPTAFEMFKTPKVVTPPLGNLKNLTEACFDFKTICKNPDEYFYWDDLHPTKVGHKAIALVFFAAIAESVYVDFSQIDPSEPHLLELPFIEVTDEAGKFLVLDVGMSRKVDDAELQFSVLGSVIQTTVSLQSLFTFPSNHKYPTFNKATGILAVPIVHIAQANPTLTFLIEYKANFKFLPDTLNNPFMAPMFELASAK